MKKSFLAALTALMVIAGAIPSGAEGDSAVPAAEAAGSIEEVPEGRIIYRGCPEEYRVGIFTCDGYLSFDQRGPTSRHLHPELIALDSTGTSTRLTTNDKWEWTPHLTPDGEWFVLATSDDSYDTCDLSRVPSDGGATMQIAGAAEGICFDPTDISSDGEWLLYTLWDEGEWGSNLYKRRLEPGSSERVALTDLERPVESAYPAFWFDNDRRVLFAATAHRRNGKDRIYSMRADGRNVTPLSDLGWGVEIALSPNERLIAYSKYDEEPGDRTIHTMRVDGSHKRLLTRAPSYTSDLSWSPDGSALAYVSASEYGVGSVYRLRTIDVRTRDKVTLPLPKGRRLSSNQQARWSPTGEHLAFATANDKWEEAIFSVRHGGKDLRRLTPWDTAITLLGWFDN